MKSKEGKDMAARKEILDFILLERTETPPNSEKVQIYALRILDLYNERKADLLTLQNDLFELVANCKLYERGGMKHTTPDFEQAITLLLQTATDWELFLPETEIQRYERVSLFVIKNLADYIRGTYSHQRQHQIQTQPQQPVIVEASQEPGTPPPEKEKRPRSRPKKEFEDFFINRDDACNIIPILEKLLNGKYGRDAARIIVACCKGGWITEPSPVSIERKFGIEKSGMKEPLRCHFHYTDIVKPMYKPFTDEELTPIVEKIKQELASTTQD